MVDKSMGMGMDRLHHRPPLPGLSIVYSTLWTKTRRKTSHSLSSAVFTRVATRRKDRSVRNVLVPNHLQRRGLVSQVAPGGALQVLCDCIGLLDNTLLSRKTRLFRSPSLLLELPLIYNPRYSRDLRLLRNVQLPLILYLGSRQVKPWPRLSRRSDGNYGVDCVVHSHFLSPLFFNSHRNV